MTSAHEIAQKPSPYPPPPSPPPAQVISSPLRSLSAGGGFSLCLLTGEVGVGKTHLLTEIASRAAAGEGGGSGLSGCVAWVPAPPTTHPQHRTPNTAPPATPRLQPRETRHYPPDRPHPLARHPLARLAVRRPRAATRLRYADAKSHKSTPTSVWLPLLQQMLSSLWAEAEAEAEAAEAEAEAAEAGEAAGEAAAEAEAVAEEARAAGSEQGCGGRGEAPAEGRGEGGSPQSRAGVRRGARQRRQARQMARLRELLPLGLREYDLGRLLGSGRGSAGSSGLLERDDISTPDAISTPGAISTPDAISAEVVQRLICGLARSRAYGLLIDGGEQLGGEAWRLLQAIVHAAPRLALTVASREELPEFAALREAAAAPRLVGSCRVAPAFALLEMSLLPLSAHAVGSLLAEALRSAAPLGPGAAVRVHQRCGGNPLFVLSLAAKLAAELRGRPLPPTRATAAAATPHAATSLEAVLVRTLEQGYIPSSLAELVLAQLDRLTMQARTLDGTPALHAATPRTPLPLHPAPPATPATLQPPCNPLQPLLPPATPHRALVTGVSGPYPPRL